MSLPCGYKSNTETVAQYRKRCGPRPLGMIGKVHEGDDKLELIKLYNKALKMMPNSPAQKKIRKQISALRKKLKMDEAPRKPRKKGQPAGSKKHSDLYTDENPKGTIHGLKFATVKDAQKSVSKIKGSGKTHAHKIQAAIAMEQRARAAGKKSAAGVYRKFINQMKKKTKQRNEGWSDKYKKSIDCNNPKGFSQKAHCAGRKKRENKMSLKLEQLVGKFITEEQFDEAAGKKDACYHKVKARYDVWPSAYASGALVKCRKVGAKNWGNKSKKKESVNEDLTPLRKIYSDLDKRFKNYDNNKTKDFNKVLKFLKSKFRPGSQIPDFIASFYNDYRGGEDIDKNQKRYFQYTKKMLKKESVNEKRGTCWVGYQQIGMKKKGDRMVPNCVKEVYYEENGKGYGYTFELPPIQEAEYQGRKVKLNKIMQGDKKKFKVYVKNPKGNVVVVHFGQGGDAKGGTMRIRKSNPEARKSFRARHNCDNPGPKHKARYWSCRKW